MRSFVIFYIENQLYGIDIEDVKRILPSQDLTDIPDEDEHLDGMFQYEDEVIKVYSFRKMIGLEKCESKDTQRCLILTDDTTTFGINIDMVDDIVHVKNDDLHISKQSQNIGEFMSIEAILKRDNKLVTIIKNITLGDK